MLTTEEQHMQVYSSADRPTIPNEVTLDTDLNTLNLNWSENDLPEKERTKHVHRLHPYLGKFIPQLVEVFLRKYLTPRQTILDPFCRSGTTLVQANELSINSVSYDISAFNVLLSRAKTTKYDLTKVRKEIIDILNKTRALTQTDSNQLSMGNKSTEFSVTRNKQPISSPVVCITNSQ